jgi:hypothetical protein
MEILVKPADIIVIMLYQAIKHTAKEDRPALVLVLGIMTKVVEELPGDNSALLSYLEQCIKQFGGLKNL